VNVSVPIDASLEDILAAISKEMTLKVQQINDLVLSILELFHIAIILFPFHIRMANQWLTHLLLDMEK